MSIEWIKHNEDVLAVIIASEYSPDDTEFITPDSFLQQVGFIVYPSESEIEPHIHKKIDRYITGTSEVLLVRKGHCWVDFYLQDKTQYCSRELKTGDIVALVNGGHGFRMIQNTVFIEIKQGPYLGERDKERFSR